MHVLFMWMLSSSLDSTVECVLMNGLVLGDWFVCGHYTEGQTVLGLSLAYVMHSDLHAID